MIAPNGQSGLNAKIMQIDRRTKQGFCFYVGKNNFLFVLKNIGAKLHISRLSFCIFELCSKILPFVLKNIGAKLHISHSLIRIFAVVGLPAFVCE